MENGRIVLEGPAAGLRENPEMKEFYLGLNEVCPSWRCCGTA
jgi:branched-chain amino acid transport system ATP-binding protein